MQSLITKQDANIVVEQRKLLSCRLLWILKKVLNSAKNTNFNFKSKNLLALFLSLILSITFFGCKTQQSQSQPQAEPAKSGSVSSSSESTSTPSTNTSNQSSPKTAQIPAQTASLPSSGPKSSSGTSKRNSSQPSSIEPGSGSQKNSSAVESNRAPTSSQAGEAIEESSDRSNTPPDPSSRNPNDVQKEIDFSEEEEQANSLPSANTSASNSAASSRSPSSIHADKPSAGSRGSARDDSPASMNERMAQLENQFESVMGTYDGMILREREFVRNRPTSPNAEKSVNEEVANNESLEDLIQSAEAELPDTPNDTNNEGGSPEESNSSGQKTGPGLPTRGRRGEYDHTGSSVVVPADIPTGDDDDVVARQIREAATRESDPELREKLWEEYRKYKKAQK